MNIQEHIVRVASEAAAEFFRYANAVPADKLDWRPLEVGQSVLSMCREIAMTPTWALDVTTGAELSEEDRNAQFSEMSSWATVAKAEEEFKSRFEWWAEYVRAMPDEKLAETRWLPYNGGRDHTMLEMLEYPRWNTTYHLGQVAYIQTLLGDKAMY